MHVLHGILLIITEICAIDHQHTLLVALLLHISPETGTFTGVSAPVVSGNVPEINTQKAPLKKKNSKKEKNLSSIRINLLPGS